MIKKTLVLGASENVDRYSNMAIKKLQKHLHEVVALGQKKGVVEGVHFDNEKKHFENIDTISLYINPKLQEEYYDYILSLHPKRIIFNPGTENKTLQLLAEKNGVKALEACTLVMLSTGQY